jgi:Fe-S oxidoreductase/nitrate reductase gamma subunit
MIFAYEPLEGAYEVPMRVVGANIPYEWLIYLLMLIPLGIFVWGFYNRVKVWKLAQGEVHRNDEAGKRIMSWLSYTFGQLRVIRKPLPGWLHMFLFWGFVVLLITTASFAMWDKISFPPLTGNFYIGLSWLADVTGFLALIAILGLAYIRYVMRPDRLNDTKPLDGWVLLLIAVILLGGYIIEGLRLAAQMKLTPEIQRLAYEKAASPIGWYFAGLFKGMSLTQILLWHRINWWTHMAIAFLFIALVPFTKLWHIFTGMLNYGFREFDPSACRMVENIEEAEHFGAEKIEEMGWKDLMDLDACIRCGRCQENCPAYLTGKTLNPKITIIQAMKKHMDHKAAYIKREGPLEDSGELAMTTSSEREEIDPREASLIYDVVTPDVLWACTNCRACVVHCPMFIEHLHKIIEMRRNLVMWQGDMPGEAQAAFTNLERNYNPWGVGWASRADWMKERNVREMINLLPEDGRDFEYLFFTGCAVAFDDRYKKVGEALVRLLNKAEVSFACLGTEEQCCGDPARRLGNEYLYQTLAAHNIETFNQYGVKKIICLCPHGYNTIKNEYPQMGGHYEVLHASELLARLIAEGKLTPNNKLNQPVSYHDSCFLGRHNDLYDAPREILRSAGANLLDVVKQRESGFCCGAGGGRMFLEERAVEGYKRINETRTAQLLEPAPKIIAANCPYCVTMLTDGLKAEQAEETVSVFDITEILWQSQ